MSGSFSLIGAGIGLLLILGGFFMAYVQKALGGTHLVALALGAVLAGVTNVQFQVGANGDVSATIGRVQQATQQTANATSAQQDAITALGQRVDSLQQAVTAQQDLINTKLAQVGAPPAPQAAAVTQALTNSDAKRQFLFDSLARSRTFTLKAQSLSAIKPVIAPAKPAGP